MCRFIASVGVIFECVIGGWLSSSRSWSSSACRMRLLVSSWKDFLGSTVFMLCLVGCSWTGSFGFVGVLLKLLGLVLWWLLLCWWAIGLRCLLVCFLMKS